MKLFCSFFGVLECGPPGFLFLAERMRLSLSPHRQNSVIARANHIQPKTSVKAFRYEITKNLIEPLERRCRSFHSSSSTLCVTAQKEKKRKKMNVVHEAGLFQGRLGFSRAIIMLEEGCEEFSNVEGLGQIRFPKNNIRAAFHDVQLVLEREGLVEPD